MAVGGLFAYFALQYHDIELDWKGNSKAPILFTKVHCLMAGMSYSGVDAKGFRWFDIPEGGFGPGPGEFE